MLSPRPKRDRTLLWDVTQRPQAPMGCYAVTPGSYGMLRSDPTLLWDVTQRPNAHMECHSAQTDIHGRLGTTYQSHLQGKKSTVRNITEGRRSDGTALLPHKI
jgi:hypothetical protein